MLNDIRLEVKSLVHKADKSLPSILEQTRKATRTIDSQLPSLLARVDTAADNLSDVSENLKQCKGLVGIVHGASEIKDPLTYDVIPWFLDISWRRKEHPMIEQLPESSDKVLAFKMSGKLHDEDYKKFVPLVDAAIANQGKVRLLAIFEDFHGWDLHAMWDDIKFATTHCTKIERIAMVGENKWQEWMGKVCKPFTMAKIQYFDVEHLADAQAWIKEGL